MVVNGNADVKSRLRPAPQLAPRRALPRFDRHAAARARHQAEARTSWAPKASPSGCAPSRSFTTPTPRCATPTRACWPPACAPSTC
ncbi:MAG: hypothetical protein WKG07_01160 [Hymenobacter sp.]